MSALVRKNPAISLSFQAYILGTATLLAVVYGVFYRSQFGGIVTFTVVSVIVSIIIVLIAGPADLSRTNERNALKLEGEKFEVLSNQKEELSNR